MRVFMLLAFVTGLAACHPQPQHPGSAAWNVITQAEIDSSDAPNVYDLVARLRGNYLTDRGVVSLKTNQRSRAVVFLNDQEYGIPETMRNIPRSRVSEIRFFAGTDAVARYGAQYGGGVILLVSRSQ
jgi:hypothetical protein